jgi:hypothetical protein
VNAIQKPLCDLKNVPKSGFTELHVKLHTETLLDFAIHRKQNETRIRKSTRVKIMRVHRAVSRGRLIQ